MHSHEILREIQCRRRSNEMKSWFLQKETKSLQEANELYRKLKKRSLAKITVNKGVYRVFVFLKDIDQDDNIVRSSDTNPN